MASQSIQKENALGVVALDLGTTYSGWAYSFRKEFKENPGDVKTTIWKSSEGLATVKTPTAILFNVNDQFDSFGYEAEAKYAELVEDEESEGWKFFTRFKMALFTDEGDEFHQDRRKLATGKVSRRQQLRDVKGHKLSSLKVFAESIKYLKENFLKTLGERASFVAIDDIHWVLTIPAIWSDEAKHFMRMAAVEAGIRDQMLSLAYEPEAAAIFCKTLTLQKKDNEYGAFMTSFTAGEHFLVLDCGGGTVDITAYRVLDDDRLEELSPPTGGPWGGTEVDKQYIHLIKKIFGEKVWKKFEKMHPSDALELKRRFESKKRVIGESNEKFVRLAFPNALFEIFKAETSSPFVTAFGVTKKGDKLKFPIETLKNLFETPIDGIVTHVKGLLKKVELQNIHTFLMVGGFSDSVILHKCIKEEFAGIQVLRPDEAVLSVMKGAVIFGHSPEVINERVCPRSYGIACNFPFDHEKHPERLLSVYDGREMCTDVFKMIVMKGEPIIIGKSVFECRCLPTRARDTTATVDIYSSSEVDPEYTFGDTIKKVGTLTLGIPNTSKGKNRPIAIRITFQSTELTVTAVEEGTDNEVSQKFDFLV